MPLIPDEKKKFNNLNIQFYDIIKHSNKIQFQPKKRLETNSLSIHFIKEIETPFNTTPAEYFVRATYFGKMKNYIPHFYIDQKSIWQCIPLELMSNTRALFTKSISIEIIGEKAFDNAINLILFLVEKYNINPKNKILLQNLDISFQDRLAAAIGFFEEVEEELPLPESIPKPIEKEKLDVSYGIVASGKKMDVSSLEICGFEGWPLNSISIGLPCGRLAYRVHLLNGGWLHWTEKGYTGMKKIPIDAIQIELNEPDNYQIKYRVSTIKNGFQPWIIGTSSYAGIIGQPIDKIQIEVI